MALTIFFALHVVLSLAGWAYLLRRLTAMRSEITELRSELSARAVGVRKAASARGAAAVVETAATPAPVESPLTRAARAWGLTSDASRLDLRAPTLSPETGRGLVLALMATSPAIAFFFHADPAAVVAAGLAIAAAMMVVALRPIWRAAAWASVLTASAWALIGFALASAHADPASYSMCLAMAGAAGLAHAQMRRLTPGAAMALTMSAAALALGSQTGMIGPAGGAFAFLVGAAAVIGATSLRLEGMHLVSFGAAVIGLFVLSGQNDAAIWFTPVATMAGALFLAIAIVRVPQLGARGVALAGTGAFAPFGAIAALNAAQHGLANIYAAAGALVVLAALLAVLIAVSALRRDRGVAALRLTLWVLTFAAFCSVAAAIMLALPASLAAPAFAACGLGLAALDGRIRDLAWRTFAVASGVFAALFALLSAQHALSETAAWSPWIVAALGLVAPACIAGGAAYLFARSDAKITAGFFELIAIVLGIVAANVFARLLFSGGAPLLQPIGFVEAGAHSAIWLAAALIIGWRQHLGAAALRAAATQVLTITPLLITAFAAGLWITSYWDGLARPALAWRDTLGFLIPSVLLWAHWVFWRARGADFRTRVALGAGALFLAAFVAIEASRLEALPDWAKALIGAVSFALALGINFAPGVTAQAPLTPPEKSPLPSAQPSEP